MAESLNILKIVVLRILKKDLGKRKLCVRFVTHSLTPEQRSSHILPRHREGRCRLFFNKIITGDETWCFVCDPETKRQSSEWVGETSPGSKKLKYQRSRIKTMLIIFFRLSRRSAQRICTKWKNSKCRIL